MWLQNREENKMGTKGIIRVKQFGKKVDIYRHYDCYPTGLGAELVEYLNSKTRYNGDAIVRYITNELNGEVTFYNHIDIEYMYVIDCDKNTLKCYEVDNLVNPMKKLLVNLEKELQLCKS